MSIVDNNVYLTVRSASLHPPEQPLGEAQQRNSFNILFMTAPHKLHLARLSKQQAQVVGLREI